jgi:hypothetical protein
LEELLDIRLLREMDSDMTICVSVVCEFDTQEVMNVPIEVDLEACFCRKKSFKSVLDCWIGTEIDEVIYVDTDVYWRFARDNGASEDARSIGAWLEIEHH